MKCVIYKSFKPLSLFEPNGLLLPVFLFPKSTKIYNIEESPYLYIFGDEPSKSVIDEYELEKSLVIDNFDNLEDLKDYLRKADTYMLLSFL